MDNQLFSELRSVHTRYLRRDSALDAVLLFSYLYLQTKDADEETATIMHGYVQRSKGWDPVQFMDTVERVKRTLGNALVTSPDSFLHSRTMSDVLTRYRHWSHMVQSLLRDAYIEPVGAEHFLTSGCSDRFNPLTNVLMVQLHCSFSELGERVSELLDRVNISPTDRLVPTPASENLEILGEPIVLDTPQVVLDALLASGDIRAAAMNDMFGDELTAEQMLDMIGYTPPVDSPNAMRRAVLDYLEDMENYVGQPIQGGLAETRRNYRAELLRSAVARSPNTSTTVRDQIERAFHHLFGGLDEQRDE